jgi:hypothetical protein
MTWFDEPLSFCKMLILYLYGPNHFECLKTWNKFIFPYQNSHLHTNKWVQYLFTSNLNINSPSGLQGHYRYFYTSCSFTAALTKRRPVYGPAQMGRPHRAPKIPGPPTAAPSWPCRCQAFEQASILLQAYSPGKQDTQSAAVCWSGDERERKFDSSPRSLVPFREATVKHTAESPTPSTALRWR